MLTPQDKAAIRKIIREELARVHVEQIGSYDGAREVVEDYWADEGRKRVGFRTQSQAGRTRDPA